MYYISNEKLKINNDNIISTILLHVETTTIEDEKTNLLENENIKKQLLLTEIQDNQKKRDQVIKHYEYIVKNIGGIISSIIKNSL